MNKKNLPAKIIKILPIKILFSVKKINNKAQFFSIGTFLLVMVLILIFSYSSTYRENNENLHVQRLKTTVMSNFVKEFEQQYAQKVIETAAKPSLVAYSARQSDSITYYDFSNIMKTGMIRYYEDPSLINLKTDSTMKKIMSTLTFSTRVKYEFNFSLIEARMISSDLLQLSFVYNYTFSSDRSTWSKNGATTNVIIDVYGITHPSPLYNEIIYNHWVADPAGTCLSQQLFIASPECTYNMMPSAPIAVV
jgi:hypothetical protein